MAVWTAAAAAASKGEGWQGEWDVPGEPITGHPKQKKWDKPTASDFEVSWYRGKTVLLKECEARRDQKLTFTGLESCRVVMLGHCDCIDIDDCVDCEFVLSCCTGSLCVRDSTKLCVTAACRQLRLRDVSHAQFFVHAETDPCVESSNEAVLRPLNAQLPGLSAAFKAANLIPEDNRFRHAADFSRFADSRRAQGFAVAQWVGSLKMRTIQPPGCQPADAPDGVVGILTGRLTGGQSLEGSSGSYPMGVDGVSAAAAAEAHAERQADTPEVAAAKKMLLGLLNKKVRITVPDGRVFIGVPVCIDGAGDVILMQATEYRAKQVELSTGPTVLREGRGIASCTIPGHQIASIQVAA